MARERRLPSLALAVLALLLLPACGEPAVDGPGPGASPARHLGKPLPRTGRVEAAVVERPEPGRAVVEVRWTRDPEARPSELEIQLPEDAWLVRGLHARALEGPEEAGVLRYEIRYRPGRPLDAVFRLRASDEPGSDGGRAREAYVRLAE